MQENKEKESTPPESNEAGGAGNNLKMAQNPNPRANENVRDTPMEDNTDRASASGVGSEITDGEAS